MQTNCISKKKKKCRWNCIICITIAFPFSLCLSPQGLGAFWQCIVWLRVFIACRLFFSQYRHRHSSILDFFFPFSFPLSDQKLLRSLVCSRKSSVLPCPSGCLQVWSGQVRLLGNLLSVIGCSLKGGSHYFNVA